MTLDTLRNGLELAYFASGPVIAVLAALGLWQIKATKDSTRIGSRRHALAISADQCDHYHRVIIPLQNTLNQALREKRITYLDKAEVTVEADGVKVAFNRPDDFLNQYQRIGSELLAVLNAMEGFAVYFTTGIGDEGIAFSSVGSTFCATTRKLLPDIVPYVPLGHFRNLFNLFLMWTTRLESEKLLREKDKIEARLRKVDNKFVRPIGVE